jgi:hypothetical protein
MNINKQRYLKFLDTLTDALGRSENQSIEEVMADIRYEGIDVDTVLEDLKKDRLSIAKKAKRSVLDSAKEK